MPNSSGDIYQLIIKDFKVPVDDGQRDGRSHQSSRNIILRFDDPQVRLRGGHKEVEGSHEDHLVHRLPEPRLHDAETETDNDDQHPRQGPLGTGHDFGGEDQAGGKLAGRVDVAKLRLWRELKCKNVKRLKNESRQ